MTVPEAGGAGDDGHPPQEIVRIARCLAREVVLEVLFRPRPDCARGPVRLTRDGAGRMALAGAAVLLLAGSVALALRVG